MKRTLVSSIQATAGFLEHCTVDFSEGLTCVIGARGTCKSTLIESVRFAFGADEEKVRTLLGEGDQKGDSAYGMIKSTLGVGSIRVTVASKEGEEAGSTFAIEREVGTEPRVFHDGVREHTGENVLSNIEVFSQGDLQRIAEDSGDNLRLKLIDRPHATVVSKLTSDRAKHAADLRDLGEDLRRTRARISALRQELQPAPQLAEALKRAISESPALSPEIETEQRLFDSRARAVKAAGEALGAIERAHKYLDDAPDFVSVIERATTTIAAQGIPEARALIDSFEAKSRLLGEVFRRQAQLGVPELSEKAVEFKRLVESQNENFYRMRQQQQEINEALKKQQHLRRQVEHMEKLQEELSSAQNRETNLLQKRSKLRASISAIDDKIFELRTSEIKAINDEHGERVYLTLQNEGGSSNYASRLSTLLKNSRIRSQDDLAVSIAETFSPAELVDIVESGDSRRLAESMSRDLGQMNRVVSHLADHPDLYNLEAEPPKVRLDITMYDGGHAKPVETLSKGQKATAMLPLILRPLPYPLLLDQPEDDLDNSFIITSLVESVRALKQDRQLIFVTHNANLPVLGDADRVVVMQMRTPTQAAAPKCGSVDECRKEILDLLEGGARAFLERETRYGDLLKGVATDA